MTTIETDGEHSAAADLDALCTASFLASLNFCAMTPFYPEISRDLDTTIPLLGQVATLMILISPALGLAVGPLSDRYGYRRPLVLGVLAVALTLSGSGLAAALTLVGSGLAPSYPFLLLVSLTGGLADAIVSAFRSPSPGCDTAVKHASERWGGRWDR